MTLYFAYGSNMNRPAMRRRCPAARAIGPAILEGYRFFVGLEGWGSVARSAGDVVHGVLWRLTPRDIAALHAYELLHQGLYDVRHLPVRTEGRRVRAMIYLLRRRAPGKPRPGYVETIAAAARGWKAFPILQVALMMSFVMAYIYFFFGALSRQCEREADLASAELIGTPQPLIMALEKLAYRNGNTRAVPCWHHGSIAERIVAVEKLSSDPHESVRFHSRLRLLRIGLTALAVGLIAAELISHL